MEYVTAFLDWFGRIGTALVIIYTIAGLYLWFKGVTPALKRLGMGLAKRKIAIFAKGDALPSLRDLMTDSGLFFGKNIIDITDEGDAGKCEKATLFLVYWPDWKDSMDHIMKKKLDGKALIVYAPREMGFIPEEDMAKLNEHRNVTVTNLRGRLLNDLVVSMITTGYEKK